MWFVLPPDQHPMSGADPTAESVRVAILIVPPLLQMAAALASPHRHTSLGSHCRTIGRGAYRGRTLDLTLVLIREYRPVGLLAMSSTPTQEIPSLVERRRDAELGGTCLHQNIARHQRHDQPRIGFPGRQSLKRISTMAFAFNGRAALAPRERPPRPTSPDSATWRARRWMERRTLAPTKRVLVPIYPRR